MYRPSELIDGLEPHAMILPAGHSVVASRVVMPGAGVYPGCVQQVGTGRGAIPGTVLRPHLTLI